MIAKITKMGDPSKVMKAVEILEFRLTANKNEVYIKIAPGGKAETLIFNEENEWVEILTNNGESITTIRSYK